MKLTLDKFLGLSNEEFNKELLKAKLDYASILKYATKEYNDLLKDKKWPPALSPSDSSTSTLAGLHHASTSAVLTKDSVLALIQKAIWTDKGQRKEHWLLVINAEKWAILLGTVPTRLPPPMQRKTIPLLRVRNIGRG